MRKEFTLYVKDLLSIFKFNIEELEFYENNEILLRRLSDVQTL